MSSHDDIAEDAYVTDTAKKGENVPVVADGEEDQSPIDDDVADSDEQLERDDNDAIDESNIIKDRTRGATPPGGYAEPGDDEGLPSE